jgi:hypothetical protein
MTKEKRILQRRKVLFKTKIYAFNNVISIFKSTLKRHHIKSYTNNEKFFGQKIILKKSKLTQKL